jgi:hypothetical protein
MAPLPRIQIVVLTAAVAFAVACRSGVPVVDTGPKPPTQDGTIAGHVSTGDKAVAVASRIVRAISVESGLKFEATTNNAGTYTLKVPPGRYRLEVELRPGEKLVKEPGETEVHKSDLDPNRDFVITAGP